ncbi:PREDICTED: GTPase IMAP family member 8-like [Branchiostoma belcheri]|uniref:GTPase IMAP family member 8-like n=1 Tax=Branchiostoma belcheri TaxID=7741 RepID=A0A6P5ABI7_BRABE|nr:PREDICTED: GTPase IMAP family member 8-like [Branchiostoma belcheri]
MNTLTESNTCSSTLCRSCSVDTGSVKQVTAREEPQTSNDVPSVSTVNILLVGCKRNGKSETGNTLVNQKAFKVTRKGGTQESEKCTNTLDGLDGVKIKVTVVDTPGLSEMPKKSELDEVKKGANMMTEGVDAVVLVWNNQSDENEDKENEVFHSLHKMFGDDLYKHLVIIVTHMEQEELPQFLEELPAEMKDLVDKCEERIVAFDNKSRDKEALNQKTEQLLQAMTRFPTQRLQIKHEKKTTNVEDINLLLIGCKCNGKSSTANTILGENMMIVSKSGTKKSQREITSYIPPWCDDLEVKIGVTDTPGVSKEMTESEFKQLEKAVHKNPGGIDAIVLVWSDRMSEDIAELENKAFQSLHRMFGDEMKKHLLIAVTSTMHNSIEEFCQELPESLQSIQQNSQGTFGFDNKYKDNQDAIHKLIIAAQDIKRNHGRYTKEHLYPTCRIQPGEELRVAVIGKTGSGKSSTANMIVGSDEFGVTCSASSQTKVSTYEIRNKGDRKIAVVDTPGICDTDSNHDYICNEICKIATTFSKGLHALLLVVTLARFTQEEVDAIEMLRKLFGEEFMEYVVIVLTHKDDVDQDPKFMGDVEKYIDDAPKNFKKLLEECKGQYVLFDNKTRDETLKRQQLAKLVNLITDRTAVHPFTDEIFEEGQREKDKIIEEITVPKSDDDGVQNPPLAQTVSSPRGQNDNPDDKEGDIHVSPHPEGPCRPEHAPKSDDELQNPPLVQTVSSPREQNNNPDDKEGDIHVSPHPEGPCRPEHAPKSDDELQNPPLVQTVSSPRGQNDHPDDKKGGIHVHVPPPSRRTLQTRTSCRTSWTHRTSDSCTLVKRGNNRRQSTKGSY